MKKSEKRIHWGMFHSALGESFFLFERDPLVAIRQDMTYQQRYEIPRDDWPWALRGKDPTTYEIMQAEAGPEDTRPVFLALTVYMDKFRRGWCHFQRFLLCFFYSTKHAHMMRFAGETATDGLTNGVYGCCRSFRTAKDPIATFAALHSSIPTHVIGSIFRQQQELWVSRETFEFPLKLSRDADWPEEVPFADRITHSNDERYVIQGARTGYVLIDKGQADLPVYKENSALGREEVVLKNNVKNPRFVALEHRIHGTSALLGCASTFEPRMGPLLTDIPCVDVSRHVGDAIIDNWTRMCKQMRSRPGAAKVGASLLAGAAYTASGIQASDPAFAPHPVAMQYLSPDLLHSIALNSGVALLSFVRERAMRTDQHLVRLSNF